MVIKAPPAAAPAEVPPLHAYRVVDDEQKLAVAPQVPAIVFIEMLDVHVMVGV
jgi:hypothetical protein